MTVKGIHVVEEMIIALQNYPKQYPISMFGADNCPIGILSEKKEKNGELYRWITLGVEAPTKVTKVEELMDLLKQCPSQMVITMRDGDNKFSQLYLAKEGLKGSPSQWLVICDKQAYEKYYQETQSIPVDLKQQALDKLLKEMLGEHTTTEDIIHNWLCEQEEEALWKGILKEDRSIKQAVQYCIEQAFELGSKQQALMLDNETGFKWVREYFLLEKVELTGLARGFMAPPPTPTKPKTLTPKKVEKKQEGGIEQIDLFV